MLLFFEFVGNYLQIQILKYRRIYYIKMVLVRPFCGAARFCRPIISRFCGNGHSQALFSTLDLLAPTPGTRDFYPEQFRQRQWLHGRWIEAARLFSFEQVDTPLVEYADMYVRHPLEAVNAETYTFRDSSKGHPMQLRVDATPSLVRMVVAQHPSATYPSKWFSVPQIWRQQAGFARREHFQWNMDVWGVAGVEAEAELLGAAVAALRAMGLTEADVVFKISSRKLLNGLMVKSDIPADKWRSMYVLLDRAMQRRDGAECGELSKDLDSLGVSREQFQRLVEQLKIQDLDHFAAQLGEDDEGLWDVRRLLELLDRYGLGGWARFDPGVVRGLAYYSGVVFEAFDAAGGTEMLCGGGRYDHMLRPMFVVHNHEYPTTAVGFGMGDIALEGLLRRRGLLPDLSAASGVEAVVLCTAAGSAAQERSFRVVSALRGAGVSVDFIVQGEEEKEEVESGKSSSSVRSSCQRSSSAAKRAQELGARYLIVNSNDSSSDEMGSLTLTLLDGGVVGDGATEALVRHAIETIR